LSSPRRRGPTTTDVNDFHSCRVAIAWLRRLGPRLRGDDSNMSRAKKKLVELDMGDTLLVGLEG